MSSGSSWKLLAQDLGGHAGLLSGLLRALDIQAHAEFGELGREADGGEAIDPGLADASMVSRMKGCQLRMPKNTGMPRRRSRASACARVQWSRGDEPPMAA